MTDSIRQQIVDEIDSRFKGITAFGENVFGWRTNELDETELPALCYKDVSEESINSNFGYQDFWMTIEVVIVVEEGSVSAETIRNFIADVLVAIGMDITWGNLAMLTEPISDEIIVKEDSNVIAGARIAFRIQYRIKSFNPYSQ
jgi:hypothetical protein